MPNTDPPLDERPRVEYVVRRAREVGLARVFPIAAVTRGQQGEQLTEIQDLVEAGAVAISDDGKPVRNAEIMRRALELTRELKIPVIQHAEDPDLKGAGVMHEGWVSTRIGLKGIPDAAESVMVARDTRTCTLGAISTITVWSPASTLVTLPRMPPPVTTWSPRLRFSTMSRCCFTFCCCGRIMRK